MKADDMDIIPNKTDVAVIPVMRENSNNSIMNRRLFWSWFCVGCLAFAFDDSIQPHIKALGRHRTVNFMAENSQRLAETGGIIAFVVAMAVVGRGLLKPSLIALLGVAVAVHVCKFCFGRVRPQWSGDLTVFHGPLGFLGNCQGVPIDSMPSGHTAVAFAMAQVLAARWPRVKWLWFVLACGVAVSRTLVDVHFPSDVIFGALLGTLVGCWALSLSDDSELRIIRRTCRMAGPISDADRTTMNAVTVGGQ